MYASQSSKATRPHTYLRNLLFLNCLPCLAKKERYNQIGAAVVPDTIVGNHWQPDMGLRFMAES